jgi:hypothetical protein
MRYFDLIEIVLVTGSPMEAPRIMQAATADHLARKNLAQHVSTAGSWDLEDFTRSSSKHTESLPIGTPSILQVSLYLSVNVY